MSTIFTLLMVVVVKRTEVWDRGKKEIEKETLEKRTINYFLSDEVVVFMLMKDKIRDLNIIVLF